MTILTLFDSIEPTPRPLNVSDVNTRPRHCGSGNRRREAVPRKAAIACKITGLYADSMQTRNYIASNIAKVRAQIDDAARAAGRAPEEITLVVLSHGRSQGEISAAITAGQIDFAETRLAEAMMKFPPLLQQHPQVRLHFTGKLQRQRAQDAFRMCHTIETIDRPALSERVAKDAESFGFCPNLLIQINITDTPDAPGIALAEANRFIRETKKRFGDALRGLMCGAPPEGDPTMHYKYLTALASDFRLPVRSMGTDADFEIAIRAGATMVRIGDKLFRGAKIWRRELRRSQQRVSAAGL
jgi:pyridoxal phosphate enzyme (YggS family)